MLPVHPSSLSVYHCAFLLVVFTVPSFTCLPAFSLQTEVCQSTDTLKTKRKGCAYVYGFECLPFLMCDNSPVLEIPHAEVVNLHKEASFFSFFFSEWALFLQHLSASPSPITAISPRHPLSITLCTIFYSYLSISVFLSLRLFLSFSPFSNLSQSTLPPTPLHSYTHTHASSIAIPVRSRLVWQRVGLCP